MKYALLLRGINVGGKNSIAMSDLRVCLEKMGHTEVSTLLNSGNVVFASDEVDTVKIAQQIEAMLIDRFHLDSKIIRVLVLSKDRLKSVISSAPKGFGTHPELCHSDVAFLIEGSVSEAIKEFECHPDVDHVWPGKGVVFYQRLSSKRTKSRLGRIITKPSYKLLTIRTWNTVHKIYARMGDV